MKEGLYEGGKDFMKKVFMKEGRNGRNGRNGREGYRKDRRKACLWKGRNVCSKEGKRAGKARL